MSSPRPGLLFIDASRQAAGLRLWGMNLVERVRRQASLLGIDRVAVCVSDASEAAVVRWRADLDRLHPQHCQIVRDAGQVSDAETSGGVLVADGDTVHDDRTLEALLTGGADTAITSQDAAVAWLSPDQWMQRRGRLKAGGIAALVDDLPSRGVTEIGDYVPELRLTMPAFMIRVVDEKQLKGLDHLLYHRTFKGVIDAIARYGYYHFVRFVTRGLARTTLTPNLFTLLSIAGIWVAVPLFATGHFGWGCLSAWIGVILDSVDGKLARLTMQLSDAMGAFEHLSAMPGLGLWFVATGWALTDGRLLDGSMVDDPLIPGACGALVVSFLVDKVVSGAFRKHFGRELFDARPFDAFFHLIAVRRNMHLLILTIGVLLGDVQTAFLAMAAGMVATLAVHVFRYGWIAVTGGVSSADGR